MKDMERRRLLPEQFFKYVTQPISREEMNLWVKAHNINVAKVSLFGDYLSSLYNLVNDTYLGLDVIKTDKEITGHFNWCWEKTINNFNKENINFNVECTHYDYFVHLNIVMELDFHFIVWPSWILILQECNPSNIRGVL